MFLYLLYCFYSKINKVIYEQNSFNIWRYKSVAKQKVKASRQKETEWSMVDLTICGKYLDPEKVFGKLKIIPDDRGKLGEYYRENRQYGQGFWSIKGRPSHGRIETQMKNILQRISPYKQKIRKIIQQEKAIEYAYVKIAFAPPEGYPNACYCFDSELINEFTSLGIDIALSIHIQSEWDKVFAENNKKQQLNSKNGSSPKREK